MLTVREDDRDRATILRATVAGGIGKLAGVEAPSNVDNVGTLVRAIGLVEIEEYWQGWALRVGGGVATESVVVDEVAGQQEREGSYAPVGAVTVVFTPVIARGLEALFRGR